jgi:hypothetical protein
MGLNSKYFGNEFYNGLIKQYSDELYAFDKRNHEIATLLSKTIKTKLYVLAQNVISMLIAIVLICSIYIFIVNTLNRIVVIIICLTLIGILNYIRENVKTRHEKYKSEYLGRYKNELSLLETRKLKACNIILAKWENYNESFIGYPPDWNERRNQVKKRDGYHCQKCGWPKGFQRLSRNLHVHHKRQISNGGDNRLDNLITLCHVCHKKEAGPGHKQISYRPQKRK